MTVAPAPVVDRALENFGPSGSTEQMSVEISGRSNDYEVGPDSKNFLPIGFVRYSPDQPGLPPVVVIVSGESLAPYQMWDTLEESNHQLALNIQDKLLSSSVFSGGSFTSGHFGGLVDKLYTVISSSVSEYSPFEKLDAVAFSPEYSEFSEPVAVPSKKLEGIISAFRENAPRSDRDEIADRIVDLTEADDEDEDLVEPSYDSLLAMFMFLRSEPGIKTPGIVLTPNGNFRALWSTDKSHHFAVEFLPLLNQQLRCRYVVFAPGLINESETIRTSGNLPVNSLLAVVEPMRVSNWVFD